MAFSQYLNFNINKPTMALLSKWCLMHLKNIYAMECNHQMKNPLIKFGQRIKFFLSFIHDSSSVLQNWVTCHSAVAAKHWNPRQRRKKEKAIRIFGDFLYCALCTMSLWTKIKNQKWKLWVPCCEKIIFWSSTPADRSFWQNRSLNIIFPFPQIS